MVAFLLVARVAAAAPAFVPVPGSPFATTGSPESAAFSPSGHLLATADGMSGLVSVYSVAADGSLSPAPGSPVATGTDTQGVAFNPSGDLLAVAHPDDGTGEANVNTVAVFSVGAAGQLTPVAGSPFSTGGYGPESVAFSPSGGLLAVGNYGQNPSNFTFSNSVSVFAVEAGGTLAPVQGSPFPIGAQPLALNFSPDGRWLATADSNMGAGSVSVFSVGVSGGLTGVGGASSLGLEPTSVSFGASGGLLALGTASTDAVPVYSVSASGQLTQVAGSPFATPGRPSEVVFSRNGRLLAAGNYNSGLVSVFSVGVGGSLTQVPGSPLAAGPSLGAVAFSPTSGLLAATEQSAIAVFSVGPPTAVIASPSAGQGYSLGQLVATSFSCSDAAYAPGIASCQDSGGAAAPSGQLDTSALGPHTYTVTATSIDGQRVSAGISYTVVPVSPAGGSGSLGVGAAAVSGATATVPLACRRSSGQCTGVALGTVKVREVQRRPTGRGHKRGERRSLRTVTVTVARGSYSVAAGTIASVRVSLNAAGRRLLAGRYRLAVELTFTGGVTETLPVVFSYPRLKLPVSYSWVWFCGSGACYTTVKALTVNRLPAHARVSLACSGRGCSFRRRTLRPRGSRLAVAEPTGRDHLAPGTTLTLEITAPGHVGEVVVSVMRDGRFPAAMVRCLPPGARRPQRCVRGS